MNEKMQFVIACILVIVCTVTSAADLPATSEEFHHTVVLDANETIVVHWNYDKETITFEVHCRTAGWCGIGFSDNGNMIFADIVIGWVKDGKGVITDRHGDDHNTFPPMDDVQDVKLLWSEEAEGWTKLKFSRDIVSCDVDNDRDITGDTTKVIFGWGETDPLGDDVAGADYHGYEHRGARSVILLGTEEKKVQQIPEGEDHHSFDIRVRDFHVPVLPGEEDTYYNCRMFEFPQYDSKHHLVKVEPIITPGNELNVHHMILYECTGNLTGSEGINQNGECFSNNMPKDFHDCGFAFQAWAIGGGPIYYPPHVGYPLGVANAPTHVLLEIHYDNPRLRTDIVDSSGLRFTVTEQLRKYDAGLLSIGQTVDPFTHLIPPHAETFTNVGDCHHDCLDHYMAEEGFNSSIHVFGVVLHSHLLGRSLTVRHVRFGKELQPLVRDDAYDFNYQQARFLPEEREVKRGDDIQMVCSYNSMNRNNMTLGGLSTEREMCIAFVWYYPKLAVTYCESSPNMQAVMHYFGVNEVEVTSDAAIYDLDLDDVRILDPPELAGLTMGEVVNSLEWNEKSADEFSEAMQKMIRRANCNSPGEYPKIGVGGSGLLPPVDNNRPYVEPAKNCSTSEAEVAPGGGDGGSGGAAGLASSSHLLRFGAAILLLYFWR